MNSDGIFMVGVDPTSPFCSYVNIGNLSDSFNLGFTRMPHLTAVRPIDLAKIEGGR